VAAALAAAAAATTVMEVITLPCQVASAALSAELANCNVAHTISCQMNTNTNANNNKTKDVVALFAVAGNSPFLFTTLNAIVDTAALAIVN